MQMQPTLYERCQHILDIAIANGIVVGEPQRWAVLCEDGILNEYPYWQVIRHLVQNDQDRAFLECQLRLNNISY
jgi:hypothetical protein